MTHVQYPLVIPDIVHDAKRLATKLGFDLRPEGNRPGELNGPSCCIDEVGILLRTLCGTITDGVVGEIGTGAGVGSSWIVSGLNQQVKFRTVEADTRLAVEVSNFLSSYSNVEVVNEDWRNSFASSGPYQFLFADGGGIGSSNSSQWSQIADLVVSGGIIVIDDLTPEDHWPESWKGKPDPKRELAFRSGFFNSVEIRSRIDVSTLVMVRN